MQILSFYNFAWCYLIWWTKKILQKFTHFCVNFQDDITPLKTQNYQNTCTMYNIRTVWMGERMDAQVCNRVRSTRLHACAYIRSPIHTVWIYTYNTEGGILTAMLCLRIFIATMTPILFVTYKIYVKSVMGSKNICGSCKYTTKKLTL